MKIIALSDWRRFNKEELLANVPALLTIEGTPTLVIDKPENMIVLSDLHPRVQTQLRAQEMKARAGMPPAKKIFVEDVRPAKE